MMDQDSASTLCNSIVVFAQEEMPLVAGAEGKGLPLVELLLSLTACNLPRIPILTLDLWLELQVCGLHRELWNVIIMYVFFVLC